MVWKPEEEKALAKEIAKRVNSLRYARGEKIKDLAEATGLSYNTLSSFLQGRYILNQSGVAKLAEHYNVSTDYLYGRTDRMRGAILFRKLQSLSPEDLERVNAMISIMRHDYAMRSSIEDEEAPSEPVDLKKRRRVRRRPEKKEQTSDEQP